VPVLREALLTMSRSSQLKDLVTRLPVSSGLVSRFVAGEDTEDAVRVSRALAEQGLQVTLDHLGEDTTDIERAAAVTSEYEAVLSRLADCGLTSGTEVSVKLSAVGQALPGDGEKIALDNALQICAAARTAGTAVTFDMEDHTTTDSTLAIVREVRRDFPDAGAVVQSQLRRTESDCRELAYEGSRVRLCKGAYNEPDTVAYRSTREVDRSYVRCLKVLMAGQGFPMIATHDPRLIDIAGALAVQHDRAQGTYEYQMLYGVRPEEQRRLAASGEVMRVYVPYGEDWYGYLVRRLAERPANVQFFLRALASKS
jgi:proline dehydrogenase